MELNSIFLITYWTVLIAELVGDKSLYTIASLSLRYPSRSVLGGISVAFAAKMAVAVLLGQTLAQAPQRWLAGLSAVTFFVTALLIWRRRAEGPREPEAGWSGTGVAVAFACIFFSEWADFGQLAAALITAQYHSPVATWLGGTAAMITKGVLALTIGVKLRERVSVRLLRRVATFSCLLMGTIALAEAVLR